MSTLKNSSEAPITAAEWRTLLASAFSVDDFLEIAEKLKGEAQEGNLEAVRMILERLIGRSRAEAVVAPKINLPALSDSEACAEALSIVLQSQAAQTITAEQAESLRKTIAAAAQVHRTLAGESAAEIMEQLGSLPVYLEAGKDPVQAFEEAMAARTTDAPVAEDE